MSHESTRLKIEPTAPIPPTLAPLAAYYTGICLHHLFLPPLPQSQGDVSATGTAMRLCL